MTHRSLSLLLLLFALTVTPANGQKPSSGTGYLGVEWYDLPPAADEKLARAFDFPRHTIKIIRVTPASPADSALTRRDYVVAINGERLDEEGAFREHLAQSKPGDEWSLRIHRLIPDTDEVRWMTVEVVLGKAE